MKKLLALNFVLILLLSWSLASSQGAIRFVADDGSDLFPAFGFLSDDDGSGTGFYRPDVNSIGIATNGFLQGFWHPRGFSWWASEKSIANNGNGNPASYTLSCNGSLQRVSCNDPQNCNVTVEVAQEWPDHVCTIVSTGPYKLSFADTSTQNLKGAYLAGTDQVLSLLYSVNHWIETNRSPN